MRERRLQLPHDRHRRGCGVSRLRCQRRPAEPGNLRQQGLLLNAGCSGSAACNRCSPCGSNSSGRNRRGVPDPCCVHCVSELSRLFRQVPGGGYEPKEGTWHKLCPILFSSWLSLTITLISKN